MGMRTRFISLRLFIITYCIYLFNYLIITSIILTFMQNSAGGSSFGSGDGRGLSSGFFFFSRIVYTALWLRQVEYAFEVDTFFEVIALSKKIKSISVDHEARLCNHAGAVWWCGDRMGTRQGAGSGLAGVGSWAQAHSKKMWTPKSQLSAIFKTRTKTKTNHSRSRGCLLRKKMGAL
ncbi:hypothetical protein T492DRAFT_133146 [Pavlovales sp. CCMP2436]|nr:hypothetical protein T492DRAFT_133146 [Pavlovales sp. CCMP2436]